MSTRKLTFRWSLSPDPTSDDAAASTESATWAYERITTFVSDLTEQASDHGWELTVEQGVDLDDGPARR
ncbi:hypothetical protein [Patulibacter sp. SYSU D01012]|uniref:hypothetical protein n=1 Tax=Patulibacter sp. SYSU D01012 TaxID=2817381 RepID=UPI001B310FC0|nr:hypothetical protein [Patulibacter sp. SYSU D01012]